MEKRRAGLWVLIREASNARNLVDLLPLVARFGPEGCAFCTDDREPDFLVREGHIDQMCRVAVANGIAPEDALVLATLNPAHCHGLADAGAIAPGFRADLVLLDDLESFRVDRVWKDGVPVVEGGVAAAVPHIEVPVWVRQTVRAAPVGLTHAGPALERPRRAGDRDRAGPAHHPRARRDPDRARAAWWWPTRSATWPRSPSWSATTPRAGSASGS